MKRLLLVLFFVCVPLVSQARTLAELIEDFRKKTWELTRNPTILIPDSVITVWLNEGQDGVASQLEPLELRTAFISNGAFLEVTMPADFQSIRAAQVKDRGALARVPAERFGFIDTLLGVYYTHGQTFHFDGHLRTTAADSIIVLYYGSPPRLVATSDTSTIRIDLQRLIVDYAYSSYQGSLDKIDVMLAMRKEIRDQLTAVRAGRAISRQTE
ncbi:MAG: hypothetical protein ACE5GA_00185 [Candidatus Zixiibacteriota bacterium]